MLTLNEVLPLFGGKKTELAKALGITKQAINGWVPDKPIPEKQELKLRYEVFPQMIIESEEDLNPPLNNEAA